MFKKLFNKSAKSFDDVKIMTTRNLPIPHLPGSESHVIFSAKRDKDGYWTLSLQHNLKTVTEGVEKINSAYREAFRRHAKPVGRFSTDVKVTFDTAFIMLRDLEESLLNVNRTPAGEEPQKHYMAAYRFAPQSLKNTLDQRFFEGRAEKGFLLKSTDDDQEQILRRDPKPLI